MSHGTSTEQYRDEPSEMDAVEREVAAAQYPEGGLVVGLGLGILLPVLTIPALLVVAPALEDRSDRDLPNDDLPRPARTRRRRRR